MGGLYLFNICKDTKVAVSVLHWRLIALVFSKFRPLIACIFSKCVRLVYYSKVTCRRYNVHSVLRSLGKWTFQSGKQFFASTASYFVTKLQCPIFLLFPFYVIYLEVTRLFLVMSLRIHPLLMFLSSCQPIWLAWSLPEAGETFLKAFERAFSFQDAGSFLPGI